MASPNSQPSAPDYKGAIADLQASSDLTPEQKSNYITQLYDMQLKDNAPTKAVSSGTMEQPGYGQPAAKAITPYHGLSDTLGTNPKPATDPGMEPVPFLQGLIHGGIQSGSANFYNPQMQKQANPGDTGAANFGNTLGNLGGQIGWQTALTKAIQKWGPDVVGDIVKNAPKLLGGLGEAAGPIGMAGLETLGPEAAVGAGAAAVANPEISIPIAAALGLGGLLYGSTYHGNAASRGEETPGQAALNTGLDTAAGPIFHGVSELPVSQASKVLAGAGTGAGLGTVGTAANEAITGQPLNPQEIVSSGALGGVLGGIGGAWNPAEGPIKGKVETNVTEQTSANAPASSTASPIGADNQPGTPKPAAEGPQPIEASSAGNESFLAPEQQAELSASPETGQPAQQPAQGPVQQVAPGQPTGSPALEQAPASLSPAALQNIQAHLQDPNTPPNIKQALQAYLQRVQQAGPNAVAAENQNAASNTPWAEPQIGNANRAAAQMTPQYVIAARRAMMSPEQQQVEAANQQAAGTDKIRFHNLIQKQRQAILQGRVNEQADVMHNRIKNLEKAGQKAAANKLKTQVANDAAAHPDPAQRAVAQAALDKLTGGQQAQTPPEGLNTEQPIKGQVTIGEKQPAQAEPQPKVTIGAKPHEQPQESQAPVQQPPTREAPVQTETKAEEQAKVEAPVQKAEVSETKPVDQEALDTLYPKKEKATSESKEKSSERVAEHKVPKGPVQEADWRDIEETLKDPNFQAVLKRYERDHPEAHAAIMEAIQAIRNKTKTIGRLYNTVTKTQNGQLQKEAPYDMEVYSPKALGVTKERLNKVGQVTKEAHIYMEGYNEKTMLSKRRFVGDNENPTFSAGLKAIQEAAYEGQYRHPKDVNAFSEHLPENSIVEQVNNIFIKKHRQGQPVEDSDYQKAAITFTKLFNEAGGFENPRSKEMLDHIFQKIPESVTEKMGGPC